MHDWEAYLSRGATIQHRVLEAAEAEALAIADAGSVCVEDIWVLITDGLYPLRQWNGTRVTYIGASCME